MSEIVVKIKATLPKGQSNGLAPAAEELYDQPRNLRVALVLLGDGITSQHPDDHNEVTLQILRIEVVTNASDAHVLRRLMRKVHNGRTGEQLLPSEFGIDEVSGADLLRHGRGLVVLRDPDDEESGE